MSVAMGIIKKRRNGLCRSDTHSRFVSFCAWLIALSPMLDAYVFVFLPNIPIQFIIYSLVFFILLFKIKNGTIVYKKPQMGPIVLTLLLSMITLVGISTFGIGVNFAADYGKMIVWGVSLLLFSGFLKKEHFCNIAVKVAMINACVVLVQALFYHLFDIRLSNVFDFGLITYRVNDMSTYLNIYRPAGLFSEPAAYSVYALIALSIVLLDKNDSGAGGKKGKITLLAISIVLSASTTGIALLVAMILYYLLGSIRERPIKTILVALPILIISSLLFFNMDTIINNTGNFGRAINKSIYKVNNTDSNARMGGSLEKIDFSDDNIILGYGAGNEYYALDNSVVYMNSIARSILQYGVVGTIAIFIMMFSNLFRTKNKCGKYISLMMIILMFTSNILFSSTSIIAFLVVYLSGIKNSARTAENLEDDDCLTCSQRMLR